MHALSRVSEQTWLRVYREEARSKQKNKCSYCYEPISKKQATGDHVVARINGGSTASNNIKAACFLCNTGKGSMSEAQFLRKIKNPKPTDGLHIWLAWSRRKIWLACERACKRINNGVGL